MTVLIVGFTSCDPLESDPDILLPTTDITDKEIYVLANGTSFIDLNNKLQTNIPARIAVTSEPLHGELTDLGKGILQYAPSIGTINARDIFEVTVFALNNDIVKKDTVIIHIENDSANLPCNIYPQPDFIYGVLDSVLINVTNNDIICGGSVRLSVFKPDAQFPPRFGHVEVVGDKIKYTPGNNFNGTDNILYKLTSVSDTTRYAYGMVYLVGDSACTPTLHEDHYIFSEFYVDSLVTLPVLANDTLCYAAGQYQMNLKSTPSFGHAFPISNGFSYKVPPSVNFPFTDQFTYEVCKGAVCKTARVTILINGACVLSARQDSIMVNTSTEVFYADVLLNDSICGTLKSLKIIEPPEYGTSTVINQLISYVPNPAQKNDDVLLYEMCNEEACVRATVIIKRVN